MHLLNQKLKQEILKLCDETKSIHSDVLFAFLDAHNFKDIDGVYEEIVSFLNNENIEIIEEDKEPIIPNKRKYNSTSGIQYYLQGSFNNPPLSKQEELQLGKIIFEGNKASQEYAINPAKVELKAKIEAGKEARDKLARSNLRLVASVAKNYIYTKASYDDMVSEGYIGLVTAIDKYDYRKGFKFSTYAIYWIRQSIVGYIKKSGYAIRLPNSIQEKIAKVKQVESELILEKGRQVTYQEIADVLGKPFDASIVEQCLIYAAQKVVSLDANQKGKSKNSEEHDLYDVVSNNEPGIMENADKKEEWKAIIGKGLSILTAKEQDILIKYYGIDCEPLTLSEIGHIYNNVSKERIRQIKDLALKKIKRYLKNN